MGNIHRKNLVVLDIRIPGLYNAGHIPGAVNIPEAEWYANDPGFAPPYEANWMELPPLEDIEDNISKAGITKDSLVVVVGSTSGQLSPMPLALYSTAGITRVAITLLYAGVRNVAILDGGYEKWAMEGKPTTTVFPKITPVTYEAIVNEEMFVDIGYVESAIGKSIIVDARDYIVYSGGGNGTLVPVSRTHSLRCEFAYSRAVEYQGRRCRKCCLYNLQRYGFS